MKTTVELLRKFKEKLEEKASIPAGTTPVYQYEHSVAKAYLLGLFKRFPNYDVTKVNSDLLVSGTPVRDDLPEIESRINHFLWVRGDQFKEGDSQVNVALKLLANTEQTSVYLNRKERFQTEKSLIRKMLEQIFSENSATEQPNNILLQDLDLTKTCDFYEKTENSKTSINDLSEHASAKLLCFYVDKKGYTLVHHASIEGDASLVEQLVSLGVDVNAQTFSTEDTALTLAVKNKKVEVVSALLEAEKIEANNAVKSSYSALSLAIKLNYKEIAMILLAHPKVDCPSFYLDKMVHANGWTKAKEIQIKKMNTPLMLAVLCNDQQEVMRLIALPETDVNAKRKTDGKTALELAKDQHVAILVKLLSHKGTEYDVDSLLVWATCWKMCLPAVEAIFNSGKVKDVNSVTGSFYNESLLIRAIDKKQADIAMFFINKGANVNMSSKNGVTALHYAICRKLYSIVDLLLEKGADVNAMQRFGYTPLRFAVEINKEDLVRKLIAHPAIDLTRPIDGKTIDQIAQARNWQTVIAALKNKRESAHRDDYHATVLGVEKTYLLTCPRHSIEKQEVTQEEKIERKPLAKFFTSSPKPD
ncbi:MAG: ankyrin repeat domain-containing protein [Gammaproteobacteria bacterium]